MSINQILKKMSDLQDLSLVLYIFLVTETYDSNSSKKCETSFEDFLKSFFGDKGEIVEVCKEYITKIIEEVKGREGEIVKVCEEDITKIIKEAVGREGEIVKVFEEDITEIIVEVCKEYITKIIQEVKGREGEIVEVCEEDITKITVEVCKEYIIKIIKKAKGIVKVCEEDITKIIEEAIGRAGEIIKVFEENITKIIVKVCKEYTTKIIEKAKGRKGGIAKACEEDITKIIEEAIGREGEIIKVFEENITKIIVKVCKEYITKIIEKSKGIVKACEEDITKIIEEAIGREGEIIKVFEENITKIIVKVCKEYITKIIEKAKGRRGGIVEVCEEDITKIIEEAAGRERENITEIIVEVCKEYITKIIQEVKGREGELVKVCEEDRVYAYLTYSDDNLAVIISYNNIKIDKLNSNINSIIQKIDKLNSNISSISQERLSNNNNPFSGYALLTSATISSKHECNAEEIARKIILNIYNSNSNYNTGISSIHLPNKLTEQSIKTKISSVDLPTKSTIKQFIKLFGLTYGSEEDILYRSLILYSDQSEELTESLFYQIIPEILMYSYKVKYIYKCFKEHCEKIEEEYKDKNTTHTTNNAENLKNKKTNLRKDDTAQVIGNLEKELEHLEITYNNQYKLANSLSQLFFAAEVNFRNIQRILQVHNIPRKLLFEYCFYETERIVETMKFYHHFHYKESDKIKSDIKTIETRSNILRNKLENTENRQSEIRNIILAIIAAIIAFFELVNDELVALLFAGIFGISLSATYIFIIKIVIAAFSLIIPILIYYKVRLGND